MPRKTNVLCAIMVVAFLGLFAKTSEAEDLISAFSESEIKAAELMPDYFTIDPESIRIVELPTEKPAASENKEYFPGLSPTDPGLNSNGNDPFVIIDKIINIVERIWAIIEKNKPVVDINTQYANAVPEGITHWAQLNEWKPPETKTYGFYAENKFGINMVEVIYQVTRTYGGKYKGKGQYLTAVTVNPLSVNVRWGYKFSLNAKVPDSTVVNVGTSEDPMAALQLTLSWRISTVIQSTDGRGVYYMQGDGFFKNMGSFFPKSIERIDAAKPLLEGVAW